MKRINSNEIIGLDLDNLKGTRRPPIKHFYNPDLTDERREKNAAYYQANKRRLIKKATLQRKVRRLTKEVTELRSIYDTQ